MIYKPVAAAYIILLGLACARANAATSTPWGAIVVGTQSESERLATVDLQRYLGQVTGHVPQVVHAADWQRSPAPAVILGSQATNPVLAGLKSIPRDLGPEGYYLANTAVAGSPVAIAAGATKAGCVNAIYGLLYELGYAFFLGSESAPDALPPALPIKSPLVRRPVFAIRGVLPWYNFFDSPTAWDPVDHRAFVDQLIRSGANFIGFHTYDTEPFAAYEDDGQMQWGARLLNTDSSTWGTHPMSCTNFPYGIDKLFAHQTFGAATTRLAGDPGSVIRQEQAVLRDALDYAHRRGLHTCIGFEVTGDPTNPATRDVTLKRLNHILNEYPAVDYIWIWESEAQAGPGFSESKVQPGSSLDLYADAWRQDFYRMVDGATARDDYLKMDRASRDARAREGARLAQFAILAHRVLEQRQNSPTLVVSGWGGDGYLCSEEYYGGLDRLLPRDVVFSSLDMIRARPSVDAIYGDFKPDRQRWPIVWMECDGDQWQPQPNVHVFQGAAADAHRKGCQGMLGIHWRTRDIEENFAYLVDYAWHPGLTADDFFGQLARRCYPAAIAGPMARVHSQLDSMGWRWVGGAGQSECGAFSWGPGTTEKIQQLQSIRTQVAALLPQAGFSAARVQWMLARMDWTLQYSHAEIAAVSAQKLLGEGKPAQALATLDAGDLATAVRTYATRVTTRGEYGVLATINTKAVYAWRELRNQCLAALGKAPEPLPAPAWKPDPQILVPRLITSAPAGHDLVLHPVVLGGKPAWMHYRAVGSRHWQTAPLANLRGWVRQAVAPAAAMVSPGIEIALSFDPSPDTPASWGPCTVTVMPPVSANTTPRPLQPAAPVRIALQCHSTKLLPFALQWNDAPSADYYRVYRDGSLVAQTCTAFYPDAPTQPAPRHEYRVEAWRNGQIIAQASADAKSPRASEKVDFRPAVFWTEHSAVIQWPALRSLQVACFDVERSLPAAAGSPPSFRPVSTIPAARLGMSRVPADLATGTSIYRITPVDQSGRRLQPVDVSLQWPNDELAEVVLPHVIEDASVSGKVAVDGGAASFTGNGYLEAPHEDVMNLQRGGSLAFEFRADRVDDMPVLVSHGEWQKDGWFVQILGGRLMVRTTGGDILGPQVQTGHWYSVRWDYDGSHSNFFVDGKNLAPGQPLQISSCSRPLRIGQYEQIDPSFAFHGTIRSLILRGWVQRSDAAVTFDFTGRPPWSPRDGSTVMKTVRVAGQPTLRLEIGGQGASPFNSAWIRPGMIDLALAPVLSFRMRTSSKEPLAILLQRPQDTETWWAINLVGLQTGYASVADLNNQKLNNGQWREVRLDLQQVMAGQFQPGEASRIKNLIIGSWENPRLPIKVEFQEFKLGPAGEEPQP